MFKTLSFFASRLVGNSGVYGFREEKDGEFLLKLPKK
jgi:hypothetical protein